MKNWYYICFLFVIQFIEFAAVSKRSLPKPSQKSTNGNQMKEFEGEVDDASASAAADIIHAGMKNQDMDEVMDGSVDLLASFSSFAPAKWQKGLLVFGYLYSAFKSKEVKTKKTPNEKIVEKVLSERTFQDLIVQITSYKSKCESIFKMVKACLEAKKVGPKPKSLLKQLKIDVFEHQNNIPIFQAFFKSNYCSGKSSPVANVKRCLTLANLYASLITMWEIAIAGYGTCLNSGELNKDLEAEKYLTRMVKQIRDNNYEAFAFLRNPIILSDEQMRMFEEFYMFPAEYEDLANYYFKVLIRKDTKRLEEHRPAFCKKGCKACRELPREEKDYDFQDWMANGIECVFAPFTVSVSGSLHNKYPPIIGSNTVQFGPYYGPAIFGEVHGLGLWRSIKVELNKESGTKLVRACNEKTPSIGGKCFNYETKNHKQLYKSTTGEGFVVPGVAAVCIDACMDWGKIFTHPNRCTTKEGNSDCFFGNYMKKSISSIKIPKGKRLKYKTEAGNGLITTYGQFTGPLTLIDTFRLGEPIIAMEVTDVPTNQPLLRLCPLPDLKGDCAEIDITITDNTRVQTKILGNINHVGFGSNFKVATSNAFNGKVNHRNAHSDGSFSTVASLKITTGYEVYLLFGGENQKVSMRVGPFSGTTNIAYSQDMWEVPGNREKVLKVEISKIIEKLIYTSKEVNKICEQDVKDE